MSFSKKKVVPAVLCLIVLSTYGVYYALNPAYAFRVSAKVHIDNSVAFRDSATSGKRSYKAEVKSAAYLNQSMTDNHAESTTLNQSSLLDNHTESSTPNQPSLLQRRSTPQMHVAFIKTHKCASSTIQNIIMRFGMRNNLTFILPKGPLNQLSWPTPFNPKRHMRKTSRKPDLLCYHSVYSPQLVNTMHEDTFYLASVRDPFNQVRSSYVYYSLWGCTKKKLSELIVGAPKASWHCGAHLYNNEILDLGFPIKAMGNLTEVDKYIDMLDKRFNLMMVVEYFDESLVILRDMLGWTNKDVLSFATNFRAEKPTGTKKGPGVDLSGTAADREMVYNVLKADTRLYAHFKKKLEKIISDNKSYVMQEKSELQRVRFEWMNFCVAKTVSSGQIRDYRFRPYGNGAFGYVLTERGLKNQTCIDLAMAEMPFVSRLHKYQPPAP